MLRPRHGDGIIGDVGGLSDKGNKMTNLKAYLVVVALILLLIGLYYLDHVRFIQCY